MENSLEGGYHLYVRYKEGLGSILITDSTADPEKKYPSYAFRNSRYHPSVSEERRILDGEFMETGERGLYFLIKSTLRQDPVFDKAFHIFIPHIVEYGYPWTREGEVYLANGSWINIRTFSEPYADYRGSFADNPFTIKVIQRLVTPPPPPEPEEEPEEEIVPMEEPAEPEEVPDPLDDYIPVAVESFKTIAEETDGEVYYGRTGEDVLTIISSLVDNTEQDELDLVLCVDTTRSMHHFMDDLRISLVDLLQQETAGFNSFRIGVVVFRDYFEEYLTRHLPFQSDISRIQGFLNNQLRAVGGGDIPEAVYEGLYASITNYEWLAKQRRIILVGDAPPHPRPRGRVTSDMVFAAAHENNIEIHTILLPHH